MSPKAHLNKIRAVIDKSEGGYRDEDLLRSISQDLAPIRNLLLGAYVSEKIGEVLHYSDIFFSPRKHLRENGGLPQVRLWIHAALDKIESNLPKED
jgi:hypothetical protein